MTATPFTDYLRTRSPEAARTARATLSARLRRELGRRGLLFLSPRLLGFAAPRWDAESWQDLVQEAFLFALETRRSSLEAQLKVKDNLEGLVIRNVRNFLHERQRANDPVGYRTYELVRDAVQDLLAGGELVASPGGRLTGTTEVAGLGTPEAEEVSWPEAAEERVAGWAEDLVGPLLTGRQRPRLRKELSRRVLGLTTEVCGRWIFQDLLDALKREMRKRWDALHLPAGEMGFEGTGDEDGRSAGERVPLVRQTEIFTDRQAYLALEACIEDGVRHAAHDEGLSALWQYLRALAPAGETRPSKRRLSRVLGVSRERIDRWLPVLESIYRRCADAVSGRAPYPDFDPA